MKKIWAKSELLGDLYQDEVLIVFDWPVLFVCSNNRGQKYLIMEENDKPFEYLAAKKDESQLIDLIENRLSLRDAFACDECFWLSVKNNHQVDATKIARDSLSDDKLPLKNAYLEIENQRLLNYCKLLKSTAKAKDIAKQHIMDKIGAWMLKFSQLDIGDSFTVSGSFTINLETKQISNDKCVAITQNTKKTSAIYTHCNTSA